MTKKTKIDARERLDAELLEKVQAWGRPFQAQ
jgi:hypothetical protein